MRDPEVEKANSNIHRTGNTPQRLEDMKLEKNHHRTFYFLSKQLNFITVSFFTCGKLI